MALNLTAPPAPWPALRAWLRRHLPRARWAAPFRGTDYVIVDVETSGFTPDEGAITEIGAVRVSHGRLSGQFSSLVNPGNAIPPPITDLTGISDAMVAAAPPPRAVLPGFLDFAHGAVLVAHNASFDIGFLSAGCEACGLTWPAFAVLDTVELAHQLIRPGEVPDCKLATLAAFFHARTAPCHRALPDALATTDVLAALLRRLAATGATSMAALTRTQ